MAQVKELRLEVLRRGTGRGAEDVHRPRHARRPSQKQRAKIPDGLRDDFRNLLLADLDVSFLPVQPFNDPQRNWVDPRHAPSTPTARRVDASRRSRSAGSPTTARSRPSRP